MTRGLKEDGNAPHSRGEPHMNLEHGAAEHIDSNRDKVDEQISEASK